MYIFFRLKTELGAVALGAAKTPRETDEIRSGMPSREGRHSNRLASPKAKPIRIKFETECRRRPLLIHLHLALIPPRPKMTVSPLHPNYAPPACPTEKREAALPVA